MSNPFERLNLTVPIFLAPIGGIASPELAAATSNSGGLGHVACTWRTADQLLPLFKRMSELTNRFWGANFVLDFPVEEQLCAALEHRVRAISFFWGDASEYVDRVKAAGAVAIQVVGSIGEAQRAARGGFDLIVAQGIEAGGHVRGELGTMSLVPQIVDAVYPIPVLAAGGIADGRGVAAALKRGAAGVLVGARFLAAKEADIHPEFQSRVIAATGDDTLLSSIFDVGWPNARMRTIRNSTMARWAEAGGPLPPHRPGENESIGRRGDGSPIPRCSFSAPTRKTRGEIEAIALYAGGGVGMVRSVQSAGEIVRELAEGFR